MLLAHGGPVVDHHFPADLSGAGLMGTLLRTKASVVWLALVVLTVLSWLLGTDHGAGAGWHLCANVVIVAVAVFKVRLIGMYFMGLGDAPFALFTAFDGYCVFLLCLITSMFLWG